MSNTRSTLLRCIMVTCTRMCLHGASSRGCVETWLRCWWVHVELPPHERVMTMAHGVIVWRFDVWWNAYAYGMSSMMVVGWEDVCGILFPFMHQPQQHSSPPLHTHIDTRNHYPSPHTSTHHLPTRHALLVTIGSLLAHSRGDECCCG